MAELVFIRRIGRHVEAEFDDGSFRLLFPTNDSKLWIRQMTDELGGNPDPDPDPEPEPPVTPGAGFLWAFPPEDITGGWMSYPGHRGVDITKPKGLPIIAAQAGTVQRTYAGTEGDRNSGNGWGNYIRIDHGQIDGRRIRTGYAHLRDFPLFREGQSVQRGEVIGYVGNTGRSQGPHLHFEVYVGGGEYPTGSDESRVDPVPWMAAHQ